jgi:hypothetical protein
MAVLMALGLAAVDGLFNGVMSPLLILLSGGAVRALTAIGTPGHSRSVRRDAASPGGYLAPSLSVLAGYRGFPETPPPRRLPG